MLHHCIGRMRFVRPNPTKKNFRVNFCNGYAVVVEHLYYWSLPAPEIRGSNLDIGKYLSVNVYYRKRRKERPI